MKNDVHKKGKRKKTKKTQQIFIKEEPEEQHEEYLYLEQEKHEEHQEHVEHEEHEKLEEYKEHVEHEEHKELVEHEEHEELEEHKEQEEHEEHEEHVGHVEHENLECEPDRFEFDYDPEEKDLNKCETCGEDFAELESLRKHIKDVHENINCKECGAHVGDLDQLMNHIKIVHIKDYTCSICWETFSCLEHFNTHFIEVHEGLIKDKKYFSEGYLSDPLIKNHKKVKKSSQKDYVYSCEECGKLFSRAGHLNDHENSVHKGKWFLTSEDFANFEKY